MIHLTDPDGVAVLEVDAVESLLAPIQQGHEITVMGDTPPAVQISPERAALFELAVNKDLDVAKLEALINMQDRMEDRQAQRAFNQAFIRMQPTLPVIKRNGSLEYPIDKNKPDGPKRLIAKYAVWDDIDAAIQPILSEHGFALSFKVTPRGDGGGLLVGTILRHEGGHIEYGDPFPVPLDTSGGKNNVQAYGSALSYGKRYAATATLKLRTEGEDDDGKRAGMRFITPDQALEMQATALAAERDESRFLETYTDEARSWEEVQEGQFVRLMRLLTSAKRQVEQRKTKERTPA